MIGWIVGPILFVLGALALFMAIGAWAPILGYWGTRHHQGPPEEWISTRGKKCPR